MTYLRIRYRTIIASLAIAAIFAAIDLYLVNLSSYVCGLLLAGVLLEKKRPVEEVASLEKPKCPGCGGKIRKIAAKRPGGVEQWKCTSCHMKLEEKSGKLRQVAVQRGLLRKRSKFERMRKMRKIKIVLVLIMVLSLAGCSQAERASSNLSKEADNFNVVRQLTVINCIQGDVLFQMTGKMSIQPDPSENQLEVIVEDEKGCYQKHFIGLSDNVTYTVEQKQYKNVSNYRYTLNYNPKMWMPVDVKTID